MKIGILYICTWKYDKFFDWFYESSEQHFLTNHKKQYFVFTDSDQLQERYKDYTNIQFIYQRRLWFPLDTLMRFWMFKWIEENLKIVDFLVFFNANFIFQSTIFDDDFLPNGTTEKLVAWLHWWFYKKPSILYSYERNPKSAAYIPYRKSGKYYQWSLNGWFTEDYLELIDECTKTVNMDLLKNYMSPWHDECHLNKYLFWRKDIKALSPAYNYPEGSWLPFDAKILLLDKTKWYWYNLLRET